ncbi:MAG: hypothetical protein A3H35_17350 [Betaproteobacteria bacterium RIFCSPLOWO2_02_FULL_62_17]|nr:MAG: hypothetical protein A3H35_17350 [Betaproteobacteria bacterium RIFCSPLOWO2_02_FULL_62_17]
MKIEKVCRHAAIALALLTSGAAMAGTIYKWVDESGDVHYSESPPSQTMKKDSQIRRLSPTDQELARAKQERLNAQREAKDREARRAAEEAALKDGTLAPVPGETGATIDIQREVLRALVPLDWKSNPECFRHQVIDTKRTEPGAASTATVERWTLDRCGARIAYQVTITPMSDGRISFSIREER